MFYPCFAYDRCVIYIEICCCVATNFFLVLHDHFGYLWLFVLLYEFALVHSSLLRFLLGTFSDFQSLLSFSFSPWIVFQILCSVFSYISLSASMTILLNSLSGISLISFSLGSAAGKLLYSFGGILLPFLFCMTYNSILWFMHLSGLVASVLFYYLHFLQECWSVMLAWISFGRLEYVFAFVFRCNWCL